MTVLSFAWVAWMLSTVALYWLAPARWRGVVLVALTLAFLSVHDWRSAAILAALGLFTWEAARRQVTTKVSIPIAITVVVGVLAWYKARISADQADLLRDIAIPLGLSYYSFRIISYLIERRRGTLPAHSFSDYAAFLFFLPTILIGPINRFREFHAARHSQVWSAANLSWGGERILLGYFKIAVIANFLLSNVMAEQVGGLPEDWRPLMLYLEAARGAFNLYMLFSGYSDIAIGFARMIGFPVIENFNSPFLKKSIPEFWRAWHISLTAWSRDYIFMRVLGEYRNPILATLVSLLVIGIWHELSARYVAWGLFHGVGIAASLEIQKWWRKRKGKRPSPRADAPKCSSPLLDVLGVFGTASWFFFGYIIVNSSSISETWDIWRTILFDWWI